MTKKKFVITLNEAPVNYGYDNASRRSTLILPNGITLSYGYDNANELTGLSYTLGTGTVGTMTYGYDNDGRITSRGGTLDVTNLPAALTSAGYDANNRLTKWGRQALSYDADGNLVSNGKSTYTWNTRNQLTGISGGTTASFLYDALGRRESKTISSTSTNFLYDGLNLEQELSGTTPTVNYLTGAGIDETLSRTDSSGTFSYLTDNLGSTLALTNSSGAISTSYSYEPYGNTTASGTSSTNTLQYTGRENDGTGLYYYRARYYSPTYGRFISEDPLGLLGGINEYDYAFSNPINLNDPLGLYPNYFPMPMGSNLPLNPGDPGFSSSVEALSVTQQASYQAQVIQYEAAQCLAALFISNLKQYQTPLQRETGPVEALFSITKFITHSGELAAEYTVTQGLDQTAIRFADAGSITGVRYSLLAQGTVRTLGEFSFALGAGLDFGDFLDASYFTITQASSCCSMH